MLALNRMTYRATPSLNSIASKQHGASLIISLVILLILTVLGVQSMQTATLEEKMVGNFRDKKMAFEAAETALNAAEDFLNNLNIAPNVSAAPVDGEVFEFGAFDFRDNDAWEGQQEVATTLANVVAAPQFVIESRGITESSPDAEAGSNSGSSSGGDVHNFRITARGVGGTENAVVILQSHFEKTY